MFQNESLMETSRQIRMPTINSSILLIISDWSLITRRGGGAKNEWGVGKVKLTPAKKKVGGGGRKGFSHAEGEGGGGSTQIFGVVFLCGSLKF